MQRIFGLVLVLSLVAPSALAQAKLTVVMQQARSKQVELSAESLSWNIEVRDLCATLVKKQEVRLPCSAWRPLLPTDGEREPFYKGEVELPDGKTAKLLGRKGPKVSGEKHTVTATLVSPADDPPLELSLEHSSDTPGLWAAGTAGLGGVLLRLGGESGDDLKLSLTGTVQGGPMRWRDEAKEQAYSIEPAQRMEQDTAWRCAALGSWTQDGTLLEQRAWGSSEERLARTTLTRQIDELGSACAEQSAAARTVVCKLSEEIAASITSDHGGVDLEGAQQIQLFCPDQGADAIVAAVQGVFDGFVDSLSIADATSFLARWEAVGGAAWKATNTERLTAAVESAYAALEESRDVAAMTAFIERHTQELGEDWTTTATGRRTAVVQAILGDAVLAKDISAVTATIETHKGVMGGDWAVEATGQRDGLVGSALDEAVEGGEIPRVTEVIEAHKGIMGKDWTEQAIARRTALIDGFLKEAVGTKDVPRITELIESYKQLLGEDWTGAAIEQRTAVIDGFLEEAVGTKDVPRITELIESYKQLLGEDWTGTAVEQRTAVIDGFLKEAVGTKDIPRITELIESYKQLLGEDWTKAASEQRASVVVGFLEDAVEARDIAAIQQVIDAHSELMGSEWSTGAQEQRNSEIQRRLDGLLAEQDIDGIEPLLTEFGKHMGEAWLDRARASRSDLMTTELERLSSEGDLSGMGAALSSWEAWMQAEEIEGHRRRLADRVLIGFEALLAREDLAGAEAFGKDHAGAMGPGWLTELQQRLREFQAELDSGPPRMVTFANEGDGCRIDIVRPTKPPRTLASVIWETGCKDLASVAVSGNRLVAHSVSWSRNKRTDRARIFDLETGESSPAPRLPKPNQLRAIGFDDSGKLMAVGALTDELRLSEDRSRAWIVWERKEHVIDFGWLNPEACQAALERKYRRSGSSWKTVETEARITSCSGIPPDSMQWSAKFWGVNLEDSLCCSRSFGEELREVRDSSVSSTFTRIAGNDAESWLITNTSSPRIAQGYYFDQSGDGWYEFDAEEMIMPILWERNREWEIIPGHNAQSSDIQFYKHKQFLILRNGQKNRIQAFDLTTHEAIWDSSGPVCPVWIP